MEPEESFQERPLVNGRAREVDYPLDDSSGERLRQARQNFGQGGLKIKVYKINERGGEDFCYVTEGDVDEVLIQRRWRGGQYVAKYYVNEVYRDRIQFGIAEPIAEASGAAVPSGVDLQIKLMQQQNEFLMNLLLKNQNSERTPVTELVHAMSELKTLQGGTESNVDMVMKCIELGRTLNGAGEESPLMEILKLVAPTVAPQIISGLMRKPAEGPSGGMADASAKAIPAKTVEASEVATPEQEQSLKLLFAYLKKKSVVGSDPELYIAYVLDNGELPDFQMLVSKVRSESFEEFVKLDSEIGKEPHVKFFRAIYDGLRSAFEQGNFVELDSSRKSGNGGDTGGHAKSSQRGIKAS